MQESEKKGLFDQKSEVPSSPEALNENDLPIEPTTEEQATVTDANTVSELIGEEQELTDTEQEDGFEGQPSEDPQADAEQVSEIVGQEEEIGPVSELAQTDTTKHAKAGGIGGSITIKTWHLAILLGSVAVILVGCVLFGVWVYQKQNDAWRIDPNAKDYDFSFSDGSNASADHIAIPGYSEIVLPSDTKNVQLILLNPKGNPCDFRFTLILKDSGEVLYTSGLVPPGQAITELKLKRALDTGSYPLIIQIETFSLGDDHTPMNGANVETTLSVR